MAIKEITRFDLPGSYNSEYPHNDYIPLLDASNLKALIDKLNEVIRHINQHHPDENNNEDS